MCDKGFKITRFLVSIVISLLPISLYADTCIVRDAKVVRVFQHADGSIFIDFDKPTDCGCPQNSRMAFHKDDDQKFFMSASLTALTAGKSVAASGEAGACPIHGNTARLVAFYINSN